MELLNCVGLETRQKVDEEKSLIKIDEDGKILYQYESFVYRVLYTHPRKGLFIIAFCNSEKEAYTLMQDIRHMFETKAVQTFDVKAWQSWYKKSTAQ